MFFIKKISYSAIYASVLFLLLFNALPSLDAIAKEKEQSNVGKTTRVRSNLGQPKFIHGDVHYSEYAGPIIQSAYTAYSKNFAEKFGWPSSGITTQLPPYVHYFGLEINYTGYSDTCKISLLVDPSGGLQLPENNVDQPFRGSLFFGANIPIPRGVMPLNSENNFFRYEKSMERLNGNESQSIFTAYGFGRTNLDGEPDIGSRYSTPVLYYEKDAFPNLNLLQVRLGNCINGFKRNPELPDLLFYGRANDLAHEKPQKFGGISHSGRIRGPVIVFPIPSIVMAGFRNDIDSITEEIVAD